MRIPQKRVTAYIGPSGCGKSTLLHCFNRMNDLVDNVQIEGKILLDHKNIYDRTVNVADGWAWYSKNQIHSLSLSMKMSLLVYAYKALIAVAY